MTDKSIPEAIQRLFGEREEARAERDNLRETLAQATATNAEMRQDIADAVQKQGKLYEALERSWQPPSTEPLTEQERTLAILNDSPTGMMYDVRAQPEFGTAEHIDQLPTYQRAPRQEAPQPPPSAVPRSSTPTLKLTED